MRQKENTFSGVLLSGGLMFWSQKLYVDQEVIQETKEVFPVLHDSMIKCFLDFLPFSAAIKFV